MAQIDLDYLFAKIHLLPPEKQAVIDHLVTQLLKSVTVERPQPTEPISEAIAVTFGDILRAHHSLSAQPFTKDKFEYALVDAFKKFGVHAEHAPRGLSGHDIRVAAERWSLKTQADQSIKTDRLHISKFMELGKGEWVNEDSLRGLRDRFLAHMVGYDRIFSLRHFATENNQAGSSHFYELVEIPKSLLQLAANGEITMQHQSKQSPKPGYCRVRDQFGNLLFELYFDGGTERKLQIKNLMKNQCLVVATWKLSD